MLNFIPPLLYSLTTLYVYKQTKRFFCLSVYIWLLHTISMACFWVKADFYSGFANDYSFVALTIMYFTLLAITFPLVKYEKKGTEINGVETMNERKIRLVSKALVILGIYAFGFFVVNLPKVFAANIVALRDERIVFYSSSIFSKVACLGAFSSVFCIYFYFYYKIKETEHKLQKWLLISSTSFIVYTLNVAGRDGIVIWSLSYLSGIFLFHRFLKAEDVKKIFKIFGYAMLITLPLLWLITTARFSSGSNNDSAIESVFSYAGQALPNYTYKIDLTNAIGRRSGEGKNPIALLRVLTGTETNRFERMEESAQYGFRSNQFSSYVSFFYPSYPFYFLILFVIAMVLIVRSSTKRIQNNFGFDDFLPAFTWYMIPIVGIFYFYYGEVIGNVFLLMPFLIRFYLKKIS